MEWSRNAGLKFDSFESIFSNYHKRIIMETSCYGRALIATPLLSFSCFYLLPENYGFEMIIYHPWLCFKRPPRRRKRRELDSSFTGELCKGWFTRTTQRRKHKRKRKKKEIFPSSYACACACVVPVHTYVFLRLRLCLRRCVVRVNHP